MNEGQKEGNILTAMLRCRPNMVIPIMLRVPGVFVFLRNILTGMLRCRPNMVTPIMLRVSGVFVFLQPTLFSRDVADHYVDILPRCTGVF